MKLDDFAILSFKDKIVSLYGKENKLNKYEITDLVGFNITNLSIKRE